MNFDPSGRKKSLAGVELDSSQVTYRIHVVTGDQRGAGTDANVFLTLFDAQGNRSIIIQPKTVLRNDHERASTTTVNVTKDIGISPPFQSIEVWRDNFGNLPSMLGKLTEYLFGGSGKNGSAAWFLEKIEVEVLTGDANSNTSKSYSNNLTIFPKPIKKSSSTLSVTDMLKGCSRSSSSNSIFERNEKYVFPIGRWIEANRCYRFELFDCILPIQDPRNQARKDELKRKKNEYSYQCKVPDGPAQASELPNDEKFSDEYFFTFATDKMKLLATTKFVNWTTRKWKSLAELKGVYSKLDKKSLEEPESVHKWETDYWFGWQRVQGVNPLVLKLCTKIPEKFDVTEETVKDLIDDFTLTEALKQNKIFICDLDILDGIECKDNKKLAAPLALFYSRGNHLLPIAIQLFQQKGQDNPVYTPKDSPSTWLVAKMFYNNAEAHHHQGISHLGLTHLLMEGICLCTHRNLSPSHPMFKLMAPHFLFLLAINSRGLEKLISEGGWVDCCMTSGVNGIFEVIRRGLKSHKFYSYGNVAAEIESRGLLDPKILPYYPYRDDAISLYNIIRDYVEKVVLHHYDSPEKLEGDWELQEWRKELSLVRDRGGVGLIEVPGDNVKGFTTVEEVVETITIIISTCSLGHAAANFQQYSQYAFVPNYPGLLLDDPPTTKKKYSESDIVHLLPNMKTTLETIVITKLLSSIGTNKLGNFEKQYLYHPTDVIAADEFRKDLAKLSLEIQKRNIDRELKFPWMDPELVPNAISI